ncbi:alpha/beta hydrolase, partial [Candidatus Protofrankia datiscae]
MPTSDPTEFSLPVKLPSQPLVIVPGMDDSPPGHWQSLWQAGTPGESCHVRSARDCQLNGSV